ncbi:hypothetical protein QQS21_002466 [Conoideocrella luteorostrata]|uniref:Azaphilone pigments biosynthesis cluster protein L N-terminal domain-containing protein n=1 Tax=Conoideocrella luteorostrata TaxID=1105319 RepID=A0AAJ0CV86_9HYPO|nr:hypothetical protein QQS21_002466 [Conoideocrella luteorostrata]
MADVLGIGGSALRASMALHGTIRSFQSQNKDARALKTEVNDLTGVLESLLETVASNPTLDFKLLELPLKRCGKACEEYGAVIARCTKHSGETSRPSMRDWITQKYLQGDINDFRLMLAAHKSTINIALANANLRIAAVPPDVLETYKDMIIDTTNDLDTHLKDLQDKIDRLKAGDVTAVDDVATEWNAMLQEKESTQQGLRMCAELSTQIVQFETKSTEHPCYSDRPSAYKHVKSGLHEAKGSIQSLVSRLRTHAALIDTQLEKMSVEEALSGPVAAQLAQLQQTKESVSQCIRIVTEASELAEERSNVFEDITLSDNSYAFSVSTVNDLVLARRLNLKDRSRHFGGQVSDETVQKSMEALTQLDAQHIQSSQINDKDRGQYQSPQEPGHSEDTRRFNDRFGPGTSLADRKTT